MTFTKLFSSITESSVWTQDDHTRLVWITMLAMADKRGRVWASIPGLANRARVPVDSAEKAIDCFLGPDPWSRTKDNDGRRIEVIDGGWRLLNYSKYREIRDDEERREQNALAQARFRKKQSNGSNPPSATVSPLSKPNAEAEAEAEGRNAPEITQKKNGAEIVAWDRSLERVNRRMATIRATYGDHQSWSESDRAEYNKLKASRKDLMEKLQVPL